MCMLHVAWACCMCMCMLHVLVRVACACACACAWRTRTLGCSTAASTCSCTFTCGTVSVLHTQCLLAYAGRRDRAAPALAARGGLRGAAWRRLAPRDARRCAARRLRRTASACRLEVQASATAAPRAPAWHSHRPGAPSRRPGGAAPLARGGAERKQICARRGGSYGGHWIAPRLVVLTYPLILTGTRPTRRRPTRRTRRRSPQRAPRCASLPGGSPSRSGCAARVSALTRRARRH